jgi:hypothetical protein
MAIHWVDRVATHPGRIKLTPENGDPAFFATMERADEPTVVGTPVNAENLNASQSTLNFTNDTSVTTYKRVYVAATGNDSNGGESTAAPMATIKAAIRKYAYWCKMLDVYLADGVYTENLGSIALDQCTLIIRSSSGNRDSVTLNLSTMTETSVPALRLYNLTMNMTVNNTRLLSVASGVVYADNVRFAAPTTTDSPLINVYNGASAFLSNCVLNGSTTATVASVYGNNALLIRALSCTSDRTVGVAFYANMGTTIEYTPTVTAVSMIREASSGKCIVLGKLMNNASLSGQYRSPEGMLIQWGTVTITPSAADTPTTAIVEFPYAFAETPIVTATVATTAPQFASVSIMRAGTGVTNNRKQTAIILTRNSVSATGINWIAVGKEA